MRITSGGGREIFEKLISGGPLICVPRVLYVLPKLLGADLIFAPPPIGSLGDMPPRPHYIILYDYTFRAKVIGGGVILIFAPPPYSDVWGGVMTPLSQW